MTAHLRMPPGTADLSKTRSVRALSLPQRFATALMPAAIAIVLAAGLPAPVSDARGQPPACTVPAEITRLDYALPRTGRRLAAGEPLTIVAIGSSSTAGAFASSPAAAYPSRLAATLRERLPDRVIRVVNQGANGEDAREMLARFQESVIGENPDLVLWQVGTNALLLDRPLEPAGSLIREGSRRLRAAGFDVVLIDPQFAPKVLAKPDIDNLMSLYRAVAKQENIGVFHRFEVMRYWREVAGIPFEVFLSPDELHMNDWSYDCVGKLLAGAIAEAATRSALMAGATAGELRPSNSAK
jgi:acyl-CoA thioesterase-1